MWTDSHCHLQDGFADDAAGAAEQIARARAAGVDRLVCIGTDARSSGAAIALAASDPGVWATVGLHPHEASTGTEETTVLLSSLAPAERARVVAVGECGLDYHYDHSPRDAQRAAFEIQVALAAEHGLALVVHTREAWDDTCAILSSAGVLPRTVIHCFTGGPDEAERCLELGAWISFSGIVTFKNAAQVRAAAATCPLERMLVETDSPFLAPVPHRGRTNEPAYVALVGAAVAELKGLDPMAVAEATARNAVAAFGLEP